MMLGQRIKEERENRNWTQDDLAREVNVSRQAISKWELGTAYPDIERLISLSDLFAVSLDRLIKGDADLKNKIVIRNEPEHMNFWDFASRYWWLIFPIGAFLGWLIPKIVTAFR